MNMKKAWEKITDSAFPFGALAAYKNDIGYIKCLNLCPDKI